jgi:hypothetical protein
MITTKQLALSTALFSTFTLNTAYASSIGNIYTGKPSGNNDKLVSVAGHYSTLYDSLEQAKFNAPSPDVDGACGQGFQALIYSQTTHCGKVHHQYQCKAIAKAECEPRQ